jgi:hypothetical protein
MNLSDLKPALWLSGILAALHAFLWITLAFVMIFVVNRFHRQFRDFGMELPAISQFVMAASDWFINYWYLFLLVLPPLLLLEATGLLLLRLNPMTKPLGIVWAGITTLLPCIAFGLVLVGLWLPWMKLQEGLSK